MQDVPFRPQLGEPHHHAYLVDDIAATVDRLAHEVGAGPFFLVENVPLEDVVSGDEPAEFAHHSAFGTWGGGAIELIQPLRIAPARLAEGFSMPRPRLHHVAYVIPADEVAALRRALDERGVSQLLSSRLGEVDSTLHDATASLGHLLEIHAETQAMRDFFAMVAEAAREWDGTEPLRALEA